MTTRIAPAVGLNLLGQDGSERNQDATVFVANLAPQVTEELLRELCAQAGPVANVYVPKDRVTNLHQGYGFVEFASEGDVDYAVKVLNDRDRVTLYGRDIRVKRASQDKRSSIVGANLFIGNLDPDVDENLLYDTFSKFGVALNPKIMRDSGNSRGFGFISFDCFEASDEAIEVRNGQYLCNRQITVSYAYKKDTNGERHGTPAERALAAASSSSRPRVHAPMPPPQQLIGRPHIHQMAMHPPQQLIGGPPMHHMPPPQQPIGRPPMHYMSRPPLPRSYF